MSNDYILDVKKHQLAVANQIQTIRDELEKRQAEHDQSKLGATEADVYARVSPEIKKTEFGSDAYKQTVAKLGPALQHHYACNRHHPEHFVTGIAGMNLVDLIEMLCDWASVSKARGTDPRDGMQKVQFPKYGITEPLASILLNTVDTLEEKDGEADLSRGLSLAASYLEQDSSEYQAKVYAPIREVEKQLEQSTYYACPVCGQRFTVAEYALLGNKTTGGNLCVCGACLSLSYSCSTIVPVSTTVIKDKV